MTAISDVEADHIGFCVLKPLKGGGPVVFVGSAAVDCDFKFPAEGGGCEKSIDATSAST